jgi:protein-disulfide isomerase-like protein with CxxC motif
VNYKAFVLEQANFASSRGEDWKSWEDKRMASRDIPSLEASKCAALQGEGQFAKFHTTLHRAKHKDGKDITNQLILRDVAIEVGLDVERWEEDMKNGAGIPLLAADHEEAEGEYGVFGVPTLLFEKGNPVFVKLEEGDWEGQDDEGLLDTVRLSAVDRPYILEMKTPKSSKRAGAAQEKYKKYGKN